MWYLQEGEISGDPAANVTIYFEADNVDEVHHRLEQAGIRFDHPPQQNVSGYGPQLGAFKQTAEKFHRVNNG